MKKKNEGLKEVGKGLISLSNLYLVVFLFNTYLQKDEFSMIGVIWSVYAVIFLYFAGYIMINKGEQKC